MQIHHPYEVFARAALISDDISIRQWHILM
jgi:hypothetical protein